MKADPAARGPEATSEGRVGVVGRRAQQERKVDSLGNLTPAVSQWRALIRAQ
jgi:hypothetical protein